MRLVIAAAFLALALSSAAPSRAADFGAHPGYARYAIRAEPIVIYDFEPGIVTRAYWATPWQGRRYYPATGTKPDIGRDEDTTGDVWKPPQDYFRSWSSSMLMRQPPLERYDLPPQK